MNRFEAINKLQKDYNALSEMQQDKFAECANKLLQTNYFVEKKANAEEYQFFESNVLLFTAYFSLIDIDFFVDQSYHVVYVKNPTRHNKLMLSKFESVVLLSLRYLFQKEFNKVTLSQDVSITFSELKSELERTNSIKENLKKGEIVPVLRKYKSYNLIDYISNDFTNNLDAQITIYPSVLMAVKYEDMKELLNKYDSYTKGAQDDEDTDED